MRDVIIKDSTLNCLDAQTCSIEGSLAINTHVLHSSLAGCGVADSILHKCEVTKGFLEDFVTQITSDIPLEGFELEVVAVQEEALDLLFKEHMFTLSGKNSLAMCEMPKAITQRVTMLCLE